MSGPSLRVYPERLVIVAEGQTICTHDHIIDRSHRKPGKVIYDWRHYLAVIQRKPGALRNGAPFTEMPDTFRLDGVRKEIEETCEKLNLAVPLDGVSIGRVDFAVDIFDPDFGLVPEHFVMHARSRRKTFADLEQMQTHGPSGRFTSVTIGKQPGRR